jgi:adenosyl cobinamide kinase/adenosyl cobinamide phosphate guanylyltransferase
MALSVLIGWSDAEIELGRRYRDVLGLVNQRWVAAADRSLLLVAGRAVELRDPWELLADPEAG